MSAFSDIHSVKAVDPISMEMRVRGEASESQSEQAPRSVLYLLYLPRSIRNEGPLSQTEAVIFQSHPYLTGVGRTPSTLTPTCFRLGSGAERAAARLPPRAAGRDVIFLGDKRVIVSPGPRV